MKTILSIVQFVLLPLFILAQRAPNDLVAYLRGNNGTSYTFTTTGTSDGSVWGGADGFYTDDSRLGKAAVHAGLLRIGETGNVSITILEGRTSYKGSFQNGITTSDYGGWSGSYKFLDSRNTNPPAVMAPADMTNYRGNNGKTYTFSITGSGDGSIWGGADGIYTDDSKLTTAAVHAGLVGIGQTANIDVTVIAGQSGYKGNIQHGISSKNYGSWSGSYTLRRSTSETTTPTINAPNAPENLTAYRGNNGSLYTFRVTGTTDGGVWGGADGIYTDDSKLSTAAVHAGLVSPGRQAVIKVRILQGQPSYKGTSRNGITTRDYGSWTGSYKFE